MDTPEHSTIGRDLTPALRSLAKRTGRTFAEVRAAAQGGTLARLIATPGEINRRRRAHLDTLRNLDTEQR